LVVYEVTCSLIHRIRCAPDNTQKCVASKKAIVRKVCEVQGGSQVMAVMVGQWQKKLITTIQVNLMPNPSET